MKLFILPRPYIFALLCVAPLNIFSLFLPPFGFICGGMVVGVAMFLDKGSFMSIKQSFVLGFLTGLFGGLISGSIFFLLLWLIPSIIDDMFGDIAYLPLMTYVQPQFDAIVYLLIGNMFLTMISNTIGSWLCLRFLYTYRIVPPEIEKRWTQ